MKNLAFFLIGALSGATLVWLGFTKQLLVVNGNLIAVNRFTDDAVNLDIRLGPVQQKQLDEANKVAEEQAREAKTGAQGSQAEKHLIEQALSAEQLQVLLQNVVFTPQGSTLEIAMHNPFTDLAIRRLDFHVHCDEADGNHPPIDRDYSFRTNLTYGLLPLDDRSERFDWVLPPQAQQTAKITVTRLFSLKKVNGSSYNP